MLVSISGAGVAGDHGISGSGLGVARWFRFLGLGVWGSTPSGTFLLG